MDMQEFRERANSGVDSRVEDLAHAVIGAAIEVHRELGPGLPEISYRRALSHELSLRGIPHRPEAPVAIIYKGILVGEGYVDILVDEQLVVEIKVVEALHEVHRSQAIAYLQALKLKLALLINFNVEMLRNGIKRVIRKSD